VDAGLDWDSNNSNNSNNKRERCRLKPAPPRRIKYPSNRSNNFSKRAGWVPLLLEAPVEAPAPLSMEVRLALLSSEASVPAEMEIRTRTKTE
jgi:hypothetical protein